MGWALTELLDSIYAQKVDNRYFEVIVSDNDSDDNTNVLILKYKEYSNFKYIRNSVNIGAEKNFIKSILDSEGDYIWLIGADDLLAENSLNILLKIVCEDNLDFLFFDRVTFFGKKHRYEKPFFGKKFTIDIHSQSDIRRYLENVNGYIGVFSYIGNCLFSRNRFIKVNLCTHDYGYSYIHTIIFFKLLLSYDLSVRYLDSALVLTRLGNDSFLSNGYCKRMEMDVFGFLYISSLLPANCSEALFQIIKNHNRIRRYVKYFVLQSVKPPRLKMIKTVRELGYSPFAYAIINFVYLCTSIFLQKK